MFANGELKDWYKVSSILKTEYGMGSNAYIVAADGGIKNCRKAGLYPDAVIGDMDSINQKDKRYLSRSVKDAEFLKYDKKKDESDTQLSMEYAASRVGGKIALVGALGGRLDHELANIYLLASPDLIEREIHIYSGFSDIFATCSSTVVKGEIGNRISLISLSPYTYFTSTSGLKYALKEEKLLFSPVRGLSNEFISENAEISITEGILLIIKELE